MLAADVPPPSPDASVAPADDALSESGPAAPVGIVKSPVGSVAVNERNEPSCVAASAQNAAGSIDPSTTGVCPSAIAISTIVAPDFGSGTVNVTAPLASGTTVYPYEWSWFGAG